MTVSRALLPIIMILPVRVSVIVLRAASMPEGIVADTEKPIWSPIKMDDVSGDDFTTISCGNAGVNSNNMATSVNTLLIILSVFEE
jgi:hypothetical protein